MLYPQNGDSFATTDSVTSLHPMYISLLLVVWMTSVTWRVGFTAVLQKVVVSIRQGAPRCLTLLSYTAAANCAPGAKSAIYSCLVSIIVSYSATFGR